MLPGESIELLICSQPNYKINKNLTINVPFKYPKAIHRMLKIFIVDLYGCIVHIKTLSTKEIKISLWFSVSVWKVWTFMNNVALHENNAQISKFWNAYLTVFASDQTFVCSLFGICNNALV